jgi:glycosyltransferase involved in cell wall biosynthesis
MKKPDNKTLRLHIDARMLYMSGIGRCLREIVREILNIDKNIKVRLYGKEKDCLRYIQEYSLNGDLISFRKDNSPIYSIREQVMGSWNSLTANGCDVFYYPQYNLPYIAPKKSVFTIHDFIQFKFPEYFGKNRIKIARFILKNAVRKAKKIIVVSNSTKKDFCEYFSDHQDKVSVIHNGISNRFRIFGKKKKDNFLISHRLKRYILFVGNNKPHKNISSLVNSFRILKSKYPDIKLVIISSGFRLDDITSGNGIDKDIIIIDNISEDELILYYNCALMLVLPSFYEGFGLPIIEAMACGCPVLTSGISSMTEVGNDAANYFNPYDKHSITGSMIRLIEDQDEIKNMIKKGLKRAKAFNWKKAAGKYLEIFRAIKGS